MVKKTILSVSSLAIQFKVLVRNCSRLSPTEDDDTEETDFPVSVRVEDGQRYVTTGTSHVVT